MADKSKLVPASPVSGKRRSTPLASPSGTVESLRAARVTSLRVAMSSPGGTVSSGTSRLSAGSPVPKSDAFSEAVKLEIKRLADNQCWACLAPMTQVCHVFGKLDPQLGLWYSQNLIDFCLSSKDNGIALCPLCHNYFDQSTDPGFVFLPTDLQYFIEFELNDHDQRKLGDGRCRKVPSAEDYRMHQLKKDEINVESVGGLYRPIFLQNYLVGGQLSPEQLESLSTPKPWHGAPIGTLRRGILVLGGGRVRSLDDQTRLQLESLRDLYFLDSEPSPSALIDGRQPASVAEQGDKRSAEDELEGPNKRSKFQDSVGVQKNKAGFENINYSHCPNHIDFCRKWVLGPDFTAAQAVQRYASILHE
ncbi:uncharacterized protein KD926_004234 [Aspergillus affinis]|uniref:uncharacterized protein n=1 Tax=Aspergillus affinis TaxID=1070780 RepID=UPI0022FF2F94|nr:uncharacterized protein KD926_004234 [Aspergillus affinis]KAI9035265.1 hypothetical protein KD926_004234 [Aspergillus affinis]